MICKIKRLEQKAAFQLQFKFQQKAFSSNFWKFSKDMLKANQEAVIPSFDELSAFNYFSSAYRPKCHLSFNHPKWLQCSENPTVILGSPAVSFELVSKKIKKGHANSTTSPLDQVSYRILKGCPSLILVLVHIYQRCIDCDNVPSLWKRVVIKLISKPGKSVSSDPSSFRRIVLTSVVDKIFTSILKDYLFGHLISNGYMSTSIQKGFIDHVRGCKEHQFKLVSAIRDAKVHQRSQSVLWLDLRNAFGSVDHN